MPLSDWARSPRSAFEGLSRPEAIAVLVTGSTEQHGPHLPPGTDTLIGVEIARRAALACRRAHVFLLPPLWFGYSPHHMAFAGTLTLSAESYLGLLADLLDSLVAQGSPTIVVVNSHGGNSDLVSVAAVEAGRRHHGRARILATTYWGHVAGRQAEFRSTPEGGTGHAGEFETSVMLHLHEPLVTAHLPDDLFPRHPLPGNSTDLFGASKARSYLDFAELSASGTFGAPSEATAAKGEAAVRACGEELARYLDALVGGAA